jgi:hypothetical protein
MEEKRRIISNIYNLIMKRRGRQKPSGRKNGEEGLVKEMMFGTKKYDLCVNSSANRFKRFSLHGSTIVGVSFQLLAQKR